MSLHSRQAQTATTGNGIIQFYRLSRLIQLAGTIKRLSRVVQLGRHHQQAK